MSKNIGKIDKIIRLVIGILIALIGIYYNSWWGLLAILPIGTALIGSCPAYCPLGIKTTEKNDTK